MRIAVSLSLVSLLSATAFGQSVEIAPGFEAADVHISSRITYPRVRGPFYGSGRYELRYATLLDLIRIAYNADPGTVYGRPSWLDMDRFDVLAIVPTASTEKSRALMLQTLLADRFQLVLHHDSRPMAAYALTAGKSLKLTAADGSGETG